MANARRQEDAVVNAGWLAAISRFDLKDIVVLVSLIFWLGSLQFGGANDGTARADVAKVDKALAVHQKEADGRWEQVLQRLDEVKQQNQQLRDAIAALDAKLERKENK